MAELGRLRWMRCNKNQPKIIELFEFDKLRGDIIIGTDEAGRGPIAGPVTAGAVCFKDFDLGFFRDLSKLNDSKKLSAKLREELAVEIKRLSIHSVVHVSVGEIEKHNILQASLIAMRRACEGVLSSLQGESPTILIDGRFCIKDFDFQQQAIIKGDTKSASIAAASIIAKVERDRLMVELAEEFPHFNWHRNKGYPTKEHIEILKKSSPTKWHRKTFLSKILAN